MQSKFIVLFFSIWLALIPALAQDLEAWNPGYMVTLEDDTLYGPISIHFNNEVVQINENNAVKTYGVNQLTTVHIRENESEKERFFYVFPYHPYSDYKPPKLFEMLFSGKYVCLLGREMMVTESVPMYDSFTFRTYYTTRNKLNVDFFFMFEGEKVKTYTGTKKELFKLLKDKEQELKKYISENKLSVNQKDDLIKIILEYNKLRAAK